MAVSHPGQSSLVHSLATLLRDKGDVVLDGSSTLTLSASSLQHLTRLFEMYLLSRSQQHGFLALPSHPADTASLLQLQFLFDVLQKTISLKLINPTRTKLQSGVKIFPFKSLKCLELKGVPPHCLEGLRGIYSQLEVLTCSKSLSSLEELLSLCGGDLSSALPWLELLTLNFSYNFIVGLDQSLSLLNVLKSLDLSHNKIQECAEFLKPLSELEHLNLGYNCLQRAPTLGSAARAKLLTLNLRNNELETINGVEQLSSLRHLDLAYNLLLEHSQLAPLSLLHCLSTLNLEGNPLFFQKTHRTCTVPHLSPKAASLRVSCVLPKPGPAQTLPAVATPSERLNHELSSGAGELSDSQSVGDAIVSSFRKKKSRVDTNLVNNFISPPSEIVLPHQQEIERMSSFREQLGEDWLRYQHHLDGASPSTISSVPANQAEALPNIVPATTLHPPGQKQSSSSSLEVQDVVSSPLIPTETKVEISDIEMVLETESTLLWPSHGTGTVTGMTNSTLEDPTENVDLCPPLLMGVLSDEDRRGQEELKNRAKVFLCIKQGLVVEMDVQHGQERRRLELDSLERVETTEAAWTHGDTETFLPAVKLYFNYISRDKRKRCYVFLDDDPQQAQQASLHTFPFTHRGMSNVDLDLLSEDYEVVDHRLKLFLDVEVFEEEEELRCFLKMSAVKFGEPGEVPSLMVVSNQRIYFLEMTSDGRGHLSDWLQKKESYSIVELSYLEVGLASQTIHIEFGELGGVAYTLLVGDSVRCKRFFSTLTGIVRELAHKQKFHNTAPLNKAVFSPEDFWTPLTLLATRETLYLLHEDHQWRKSVAAESESGDPTSGSVAVLETLPISCVSSVVVWPDHQRRVDIKLYDETVKQERTWCVRSESSELLQGLLAWVRTQWEGMFSVRLQEDKAPA
uniref:Serine/threonine-protein kinase 11-interacting protein n=1 Tax=Gouania willdenowi TaxID=441366 RepID=A0A8C5HC36_GOUWI